MKVGIMPATALKERSVQLGIPFANLLRGYVIEDLLARIGAFPQEETLWFADMDLVGIEAYRNQGEGPLHFYYHQREESEDVPAALEHILGRICKRSELAGETGNFFITKTANGDPIGENVTWQGLKALSDTGRRWQLEAEYCEMRVPLILCVTPITGKGLKAEFWELPQCLSPNKKLSLWTYSAKNQLGSSLFEIMSRLELIGDMEPYQIVNEILKAEAVSGRRIVEELQKLAAKQPKVLREKRIDQLSSYRDYAYMRKRWEQYQKKHPQKDETVRPDSWMKVMERLVRFAEPVWRALCRDEVFFDDWMPELERFLG